MSVVRRGLRRTREALLGASAVPLIDRIARRDPRWSTFVDAIDFVNYEGVAGDVVELGVFTGLSLVLLARAQTFDPKGHERAIVGVDSFEGLPTGDEHARWQAGDCARNALWHPTLAVGERVTPQAVRELFDACALPHPVLYTGVFAEVLPSVIPSRHAAVAVAHLDCDLYASTRDALAGLAPALQDGTVLLFDDWFHYKGNPSKGEARALAEFLEEHPEWRAVHYRTYGTFCNAFILSRR